jgi:riboflavin biosynthesis pyrimidine reductase
LATIAGAGLLDELCLTVSPVLLGGLAMRILNSPELVGPVPMNLGSIICDDESLFLRYVGNRRAKTSPSSNETGSSS